MLLGFSISMGERPAAKTVELRVDASDISRIQVLVGRSMAPSVTLEAFVAPSGVAMLVATEESGRGNSGDRIARDTLTTEEWESLIEIARAEEVLAWRPYNAPPVDHTDPGGTQYTVGGDGWTLQAQVSDMGFPGGAGFIRLAERLSALARIHKLEDELDFVAWFVSALPSADIASSVHPAAPSDLYQIVASAHPAGQNPSSYDLLGDYVGVVFFEASRFVSVHQRHELDSPTRHSDQQEISASEWDALVEVVEADRLMEWLPHKPESLSGDQASDSSGVHYRLQLSGPGWGRTVFVRAAEARALEGLFRRVARLAEDRTSEAFPYFDGAVSSGDGAP
jgi:hypothetical protein